MNLGLFKLLSVAKFLCLAGLIRHVAAGQQHWPQDLKYRFLEKVYSMQRYTIINNNASQIYFILYLKGPKVLVAC